MAHYRSIFVSDIHLGTRACQAELFCKFLKNNTCDHLFLVGDIIDGWQLKKRMYWPQSHSDAIRRVLTAAKRGTKVYYLIGNHDEVLRKYLTYDISLGRIKILDRYDYISLTGHKYLVIHGDQFDSLMVPSTKWIMHVGDFCYNILVWMNTHLNRIRTLMGLEYWSLSHFLKSRTKSALNFISSYENHVAEYCETHSYDGVICGHIHTPTIKQIGNVTYMNDGDFCDSCSALVEDAKTGEFRLIEYK